MEKSAEKRVALVTGGAKRVGRAIVEKLARAGFDVAFTYNSSVAEAIELSARVEEKTGTRCLSIKEDLTQPLVAAHLIETQFICEFERLDLLVNNASVFEPGDLNSTSLENFRRAMSVHVEAPLMLAFVFETFLRQSRGHIVNMSDLLAEKPWPEYLAYCASKAALSNLTLSLARSLAPEVTVNAIAPGVVQWPDDYADDVKEQYLKRVPLARAGTPEDVANLVHFSRNGRLLHHRPDPPTGWRSIDHVST